MKKILTISCIFVALLILATPCINATDANIVQNKIINKFNKKTVLNDISNYLEGYMFVKLLGLLFTFASLYFALYGWVLIPVFLIIGLIAGIFNGQPIARAAAGIRLPYLFVSQYLAMGCYLRSITKEDDVSDYLDGFYDEFGDDLGEFIDLLSFVLGKRDTP